MSPHRQSRGRDSTWSLQPKDHAAPRGAGAAVADDEHLLAPRRARRARVAVLRQVDALALGPLRPVHEVADLLLDDFRPPPCCPRRRAAGSRGRAGRTWSSWARSQSPIGPRTSSSGFSTEQPAPSCAWQTTGAIPPPRALGNQCRSSSSERTSTSSCSTSDSCWLESMSEAVGPISATELKELCVPTHGALRSGTVVAERVLEAQRAVRPRQRVRRRRRRAPTWSPGRGVARRGRRRRGRRCSAPARPASRSRRRSRPVQPGGEREGNRGERRDEQAARHYGIRCRAGGFPPTSASSIVSAGRSNGS